jgi:hypothetical protein
MTVVVIGLQTLNMIMCNFIGNDLIPTRYKRLNTFLIIGINYS